MMVLSFGFYHFYWFYLTWKQYRDHTRTKAYPIWHALTYFVPIYYFFRVHAHMRSFKELMVDASLSSTISPGWAVLLIIIYVGLWNASALTALIITVALEVIGNLFVLGVLLQVQSNLNRYWSSLANVRAVKAPTGKGEVFVVALGLLLWGLTAGALLLIRALKY